MKGPKRLLFPPIWLIAALSLLSAAGLGWVFLGGHGESIAAYGIYAVSAYALTVLCLWLARAAPKAYRAGRAKVRSVPLGERYVTDKEFKARVSLTLSLAANLVYAAVNALSGWRYGSLWFGIFALYYALMALLRGTLVKAGISQEDRFRRLRRCGGLLLGMNLLLSGMVMMMVTFGEGFEYRGVLIYVQALYTFWITGFAIRDLVRYRKSADGFLAASKAVKLTGALFSMLFLETGMFAQFGGDMSEESRKLFLMLTGAGICVSVSAMALTMMLRNTRRLKAMKRQ